MYLRRWTVLGFHTGELMRGEPVGLVGLGRFWTRAGAQRRADGRNEQNRGLRYDSEYRPVHRGQYGGITTV